MKNNKKIENVSTEEIKTEIKKVRRKNIYKSMLKSTISILLIVASIAILISTLLFPVLQVTGSSMTPTLEEGEIVVLTKTSKLKQGDLCAFYWRNKVLVKRVIGIPGDTINIDYDGNVYVNDTLISEPYIKEKIRGETDIEYPFSVPENQYFVLGDHREKSMDSRIKEIGTIEKDRIVGKIFLRIWPFNKIKNMSYK